MTITDEQKAKLLDAYKYAGYLAHGGSGSHYAAYMNGIGKALEILGLSAEAERIRRSISDD